MECLLVKKSSRTKKTFHPHRTLPRGSYNSSFNIIHSKNNLINLEEFGRILSRILSQLWSKASPTVNFLFCIITFKCLRANFGIIKLIPCHLTMYGNKVKDIYRSKMFSDVESKRYSVSHLDTSLKAYKEEDNMSYMMTIQPTSNMEE